MNKDQQSEWNNITSGIKFLMLEESITNSTAQELMSSLNILMKINTIENNNDNNNKPIINKKITAGFLGNEKELTENIVNLIMGEIESIMLAESIVINKKTLKSIKESIINTLISSIQTLRK